MYCLALASFLISVVYAQPNPEYVCQCGVFVRNYTSDGLLHPNCGPTLLLNDPANPKMYSCDYDIYCEYECLQLFRAWEASFVSFNVTIPESDPNYVPDTTYGALMCKNALDRYVACGGSERRFPGFSNEVSLYRKLGICSPQPGNGISECDYWTHSQGVTAPNIQLCCTEEGEYCPWAPQ